MKIYNTPEIELEIFTTEEIAFLEFSTNADVDSDDVVKAALGFGEIS